MVLKFKVMVTQLISFTAVRDDTINIRAAIKQDLAAKSTINRELLYTVCLEID